MSRSIRRHRKAVAIVASFAAATLVSGVAWAYWTGNGGAGTGNVQTSAAVALPLVISQTTEVAGLAPGDPAVALTGLVTNLNNTDILLGAITAVMTPPIAGMSITGTAVYSGTPAATVVKKGAPVVWSGLSVQYLNTAANQDADKNMTVTIKYTMAAFVEPPVAPVLPPMGTARIIDVAGVKTLDIYLNHVHYGGSYHERLFTASTLSLRVKDAQHPAPSVVNNWGFLSDPSLGIFLATPGADRTIRYLGTAGGLVAGHVYTVQVYDSSDGFIWGNHPITLSF